MSSRHVLSNWFYKIQRIGVGPGISKELKRSIILCNSLSLLIASMPTFFAILVMTTRGPEFITITLIIQPLLQLTPILLNAAGLNTFSRIWLSIITPAIIIGNSVYSKSIGLDVETASYVGFRITMVASTIMPFLLFTLKEKFLMFCSFAVCTFFILGFDPIHSFFGVGYSESGLVDGSYDLTNIRSLVGIVVIGSCALILKNSFEKSEHDNEELIKELGEKNQEIENQLREITRQSENILTQKKLIEKQYSDILQRETNLIESRNQLVQANKIIHSQQALLQKENIDLGEKLLEQNVILDKANKDLIQMNADLQQFTYIASHNLRGPIATLLGLFSIVPMQKLDAELMDLLNKSRESARKLDDVVNDLNRVGIVENNLLKIKTKNYWEDLINTVLQAFHEEIKNYQIQIKLNLSEAPCIISIRSLLYNILSNLVNNAIKFRSPDRPLIIQITTRPVADKIILEVTDNGLGLDLPEIGDKLFMMYKRFHNHMGGKGLGLFLVKEETEILGGTVSVSSELNRYTTFTLEFPVTADAEEQILFDKEYGSISFNAYANSIGLHHKRPFTHDEYREIYSKGLALFKKFNVVNALDDMRNSNPPGMADQKWLTDQVIATAAQTGLRHVAIITNLSQASPETRHYLDEIKSRLLTFHIKQQYFNEPESAYKWLEEMNRSMQRSVLEGSRAV